MEDKLNVFTSMTLSEIKKICKDNSKDIAENSLRLMKLDDDVREIKELLEQLVKK